MGTSGSRRHRPRQLDLGLRTWGGRRPGAGRRPTGERAGVSHGKRPRVAAAHPVHVTLRVRDHVYNLRSRRCFRVLRTAFVAARDRHGMRLVHYSVQGNHVHLLVEARSAAVLARGIQGLSIRIARGLNRVMGRRGKVLADRYHARVLRTPREVRNALRYVLGNAVRHGLGWRTGRPGPELDPYASGAWFDGWRGGVPRRERAAPDGGGGAGGGDTAGPSALEPRPVASPGTWLLRVGWRRHGLLEVP